MMPGPSGLPAGPEARTVAGPPTGAAADSDSLFSDNLTARRMNWPQAAVWACRGRAGSLARSPERQVNSLSAATAA
jgi:hypothetical protein